MSDPRLRLALLCLPALAVVAGLSSPLSAQSRGGLSAGPAGGVIHGGPGTRPVRPGSSAIGDGMGGFTLYGSSGSNRYIRGAGVPGTVYDAQGNRYQAIEDGTGNLNVHGPSGTSRVFRDRPPGSMDTGAAE